MKIKKYLTLAFSLFIIFNSCKKNKIHQEVTAQKDAEISERIVSLNGTLTEILSDLGHQDKIVGVDVTSVYPKTVKEKSVDLGHVMNLSLEALLQTKPTQIFAIESELSEKIKKQLDGLTIPVHYYTLNYSIEGAKNLIKNLAQDLKSNKADDLINKIDEDTQALISFKVKPKVMFIYARGAGTLLAAGRETPTESMIHLAGGENAIKNYKGYKPVTPEAIAKANPEVLLFFKSGLQSLNGIEGLKKIPGFVAVTAVKKNQLITMEGLFLTGFGPRVGKAIKQLNSELAKYAQ